MRQQTERDGLRISYSLSKVHGASDPHCLIQPSGYAESLRSGLSWFNWWISFAPEFQCDYFCESSCLFYLSLNSDFYVSKIMHL